MLDALERAVRWIGTACLAALLALTVGQVVLRYGFGFTPFFTEEFGRYALIWTVFAGAVLAVRDGSHIRVDAFLLVLPERARRVWLTLLELLTVALFAVLAWQAVDMVAFAAGQRSDGLQIPLSYPYAVAPAAFAVAAVFALAAVLRLWRRR